MCEEGVNVWGLGLHWDTMGYMGYMSYYAVRCASHEIYKYASQTPYL